MNRPTSSSGAKERYPGLTGPFDPSRTIGVLPITDCGQGTNLARSRMADKTRRKLSTEHAPMS